MATTNAHPQQPADTEAPDHDAFNAERDKLRAYADREIAQAALRLSEAVQRAEQHYARAVEKLAAIYGVDGTPEWVKLADAGQIIYAVKKLRNDRGIPLMAAKRAVDHYRDTGELP